MGRFVVALEGTPMGDGRVIEPFALQSAEASGIPVRLNYPGGTTIGWASGFTSDEEGKISYEIAWNDQGYTMGCAWRFKHVVITNEQWGTGEEETHLKKGVIDQILVSDNATPWDLLNHSNLNRN